MNASSVGLFLLVCTISFLSSAECICPNLDNFTFSASEFTVKPVTYSSSLSPFYQLAVSFIHTVHGKIGNDQIQNLINYLQKGNEFTAEGFWNVIQPIVVKEIGYIILLVLGVAFIILMPVVGLIFCCCRCCNNCGGKRYQKNPSCCCCSFLVVMVLVCLIFMVAGVALYAVNNNEAYSNLGGVTGGLVNQATEITGYLNATAFELICATEGEFNVAVNRVDKQMLALPAGASAYEMEISGASTLLNLKASLQSVLDSVSDFTDSYSEVTSDAEQIHSNITTFLGQLTSYSNYINQTIIDSELSLYNTNSTTVLDVNDTFITKFLSNNDFDAMTQSNVNFSSDLQRILQNITIQTTNNLEIINSTTVALADTIQSLISGLVTIVNYAASNVSNASTTVLQNGLNSSYEWVQYVSLIIVLPVLLFCLITFLGCCCGGFGHKGKARPYDRGCCSNCGGNSLMCSVAVLFIFSWLLMLICTVIFTVGFATEGFVCQPVFEDPNIRGLDLVPSINVSTSQSTTWTINIQQSLMNCKANMALYSALGLTNAVNLNQIFNPIQALLSKLLEINLSSLNFNSTIISNLPSSTDFEQFEQSLQGLREQLDSSYAVLNTQPTYTISVMQNVTSYLASSNTTTANLKQEAENIDAALRNLSLTLTQLAAVNDNATSQTMNSIADVADALNPLFNNVTNTEFYTNQYVNNATDTAAIALGDFIHDLNFTVTQQVAACRPLYDVFSNVGVIVCQQLLYPLQGWWLALGWCLIFFIPAICFNVRLAKYFRKMDVKYYREENDRWSSDGLHLARYPPAENPAPVYTVVAQPNPKPPVKMRRL